MKELNTTYNPKEFEERITKWWHEESLFKAEVNKDKKPFTIVMPPPNITGKLHLGHALDNTLQDFLIRVKRMQGFEALWVPGTDHASIATEVRVEKNLLETEGISKKELGREKFLDKVWEWTDVYRGRIKEQLVKLGISADFSREAFTMDENLNKAVKTVFVKLYEEGLIYQGNRITNWCPKCQTALSDAEIEYVEENGHFWHIKYPVKDSDEFVEIATTRPETMLGDTAVAVNPEDDRYKHLIGKKLILPIVNREIEVVADSYVDMEFGTGCVKITPAHDPNDYEVGLRHNLDQIIVMNKDGSIKDGYGKYSGMERYEARKALVKDLDKAGFLVKIKDHTHNVNKHDRCSHTIEPMISKQWYVKMDSFAEPALEVVRNGKTNFVPKRFDKIYFNWMENIQDWCISRQLWWGHRIPVYYCDSCKETMVSAYEVKTCSKCGSEKIHQDEDVLDTWFSSALWPFSTLGWPEKLADLEYFYPTDVLVTGFDIIFFWVARMIFSGLHNMGETPFNTVLIHGLIRDAEGRKMSKSLDNGVDPLEVIESYGADALRFSLMVGNAAGNDLRFKMEKVEAARNFANKVWNASRYVMMNLDESLIEKYKDSKKYTIADIWIKARFNNLVKEVTENIDKYEGGIAVQKIYDFAWTEFCDWYIELTKPVLWGDDEEAKGVAFRVLKTMLEGTIKLLHPVMPFITEEIYGALNEGAGSISVSAWPKYDKALSDKKVEENMNRIIEAITSIRNVRAEMNVPPKKHAKLIIFASEGKEAFEEGTVYFEKLASASEVEFITSKTEAPEKAVTAVTKGAEIFMPLLDLIDLDKELDRLNKEKEKLEQEIDRVEKKLNNERFVSKAPEAVVEEEKAKGKKYKEMHASVVERIKSLK